MPKKNFVKGDTIKYFHDDRSVTRYEIIDDYYVPGHVIHQFKLKEANGKRTITLRAVDVYKNAVLVKGVSKNQRDILTIGKKKKIRLATRGMRN
jgi:hypothetical protein